MQVLKSSIRSALNTDKYSLFNYSEFILPNGIKALACLLCFYITEEDMKGKKSLSSEKKKGIREYLTG